MQAVNKPTILKMRLYPAKAVMISLSALVKFSRFFNCLAEFLLIKLKEVHIIPNLLIICKFMHQFKA